MMSAIALLVGLTAGVVTAALHLGPGASLAVIGGAAVLWVILRVTVLR
jgi:hypothetical protein